MPSLWASLYLRAHGYGHVRNRTRDRRPIANSHRTGPAASASLTFGKIPACSVQPNFNQHHRSLVGKCRRITMPCQQSARERAAFVTELEEKLGASVRAAITERIVREANLEGQVAKALKMIKRPSSAALVKGVRDTFARHPEWEWRRAHRHRGGVPRQKAPPAVITSWNWLSVSEIGGHGGRGGGGWPLPTGARRAASDAGAGRLAALPRLRTPTTRVPAIAAGHAIALRRDP